MAASVGAAVRRHLGLVAAVCAALGANHAAAQTPIPPATPDFAMSAVQADQYEVLAARTALAQSHDPGVKGFAQAMIADHSRTSQSLRQAAVAAGLSPPPLALSSDGAALLAALQSLRGADFDKTYVRQQILAHRQALAVQLSYAKAGSNPDLQQAAKAAVPIIQHHLQMAQQLLSVVGG